MSTLNVGLLGFTGTVGSAILAPLVQAHKDSKLNLVILHRETSDLSKLPSGVELDKRIVELDGNEIERTKKAVSDLDVIISTVNGEGIYTQNFLLDALAGSKRLKTFIHSDFGVNWTVKEEANPALAPLLTKKEVVKKAKELGVPITSVRIGILDQFFFAYKFVGTDIKENKIEVYKESLKNLLRITSLEYLGYAISQLAQTPEKIANKTITLYDHEPTGKEIVDVLTKIHGTPTQIVEYTDEQYQADLGDLIPAIGAGIRRRWGDGNWDNEEGKIEKIEVDRWKGANFEGLVKQYL
ncbi:uncharacterized protein I303_103762 [Kwoniella dejecticola CBS 10117]|uniref:NmrA-like domain-containing protein n=1 Tax=Kwoniella dejecticola CBS 10117 TaxID=1296121 RepID=A0A1A6A7N1_9TREE|nr:uncharacterized protein I303_03780 [Kwoniella dejecticola CBS 10117]OBR86062.1 hypothetical protein I303_03780 [Kwoniella dejecticola CBS 10117]